MWGISWIVFWVFRARSTRWRFGFPNWSDGGTALKLWPSSLGQPLLSTFVYFSQRGIKWNRSINSQSESSLRCHCINEWTSCGQLPRRSHSRPFWTTWPSSRRSDDDQPDHIALGFIQNPEPHQCPQGVPPLVRRGCFIWVQGSAVWPRQARETLSIIALEVLDGPTSRGNQSAPISGEVLDVPPSWLYLESGYRVSCLELM
jgi:hypothetical protein